MSLPLAAVHRQLVTGAASAGVSKPRIAGEATASALEGVVNILANAARESASLLKLQKKVTVTKNVLVQVFVKECGVIKLEDLSSTKRAGDRRGLPKAGVERIFKEELPKGSRLSGEAANVLVNAAEAYLVAVGKSAGLFVRAGKRNTVQLADVVVARGLMK